MAAPRGGSTDLDDALVLGTAGHLGALRSVEIFFVAWFFASAQLDIGMKAEIKSQRSSIYAIIFIINIIIYYLFNCVTVHCNVLVKPLSRMI